MKLQCAVQLKPWKTLRNSVVWQKLRQGSRLRLALPPKPRLVLPLKRKLRPVLQRRRKLGLKPQHPLKFVLRQSLLVPNRLQRRFRINAVKMIVSANFPRIR